MWSLPAYCSLNYPHILVIEMSTARYEVYCHTEQRAIFHNGTVFRPVFSMSYNFFVFHRNKYLSLTPMKFKYVLPGSLKEMVKICFGMLKMNTVKWGEIIIGSPGKIWFFQHVAHGKKTITLFIKLQMVRAVYKLLYSGLSFCIRNIYISALYD